MKKLSLKSAAPERLRRLQLAAYLLLMYAIHFFVYLNGDDFMYSVFARQGIFKSAWNYYFTDNGRFIINALTSALLLGGRYIYIALNPLLIMLFLWLLAKNVQVLTGREDKAAITRLMLAGSALFACLDVMCLHETVLWITGMMNYLFPATVFLLATLLFWYALDGRISGRQWAPYCAVCLFAGFTVEQYSLMFVGVMTIILAADFFKKKKHSYPVYIGYALALLGVLLLFSAPGNFERADRFDYIKYFKFNFTTLFRQNTFMDVPMPFHMMLSLCGVAVEYKASGSQRKRSSLLWLAVPLVLLALRAFWQLNDSKIWFVVLGLYAVQMVRVFVLHGYAHRARPVALAAVGVGSQLMVLVSLIWGWRCMFSIFVIYMLMISCCLCGLDKNTRLFILCSGITVSIHPLLTALYWGAVLLLWLVKKASWAAGFSAVILRLSVVAALLVLLFGYAGNAETYRQNVESTLNPENNVITLKKLPDEDYSWYEIPINEIHEKYYRLFYEIPDDVEIKCVVPQAE